MNRWTTSLSDRVVFVSFTTLLGCVCGGLGGSIIFGFQAWLKEDPDEPAWIFAGTILGLWTGIFCGVIGGLIIGLIVQMGKWLSEPRQSADGSAPVSYRVLEDYMGTEIIIGVTSHIDEGRLRATLVKAADEHQNDPARDLLLSDYLWIKAYLIDGENRSKVPAGRLRRYIPPKNPRDHWLDWLPYVVGKKDKFYITLKEAKWTLQ
jgi:hypothetical protein